MCERGRARGIGLCDQFELIYSKSPLAVWIELPAGLLVRWDWFAPAPALYARGVLGAHGHALEAIFHILIIEVLAVELSRNHVR